MPSIDRQPGMGYQGEPGPSIGESMGANAGVWGNAAGALIEDLIPTRTTQKIDRSKQTVLSPQAIDAYIYSALSGQGGISAIRTAEASSGGYGSSTAALQSADLIAAVAGEIGQMTGPKQETGEINTKKKKSVVCTVLHELGDIPDDLYYEGSEEFQKLPLPVIYGYHFWGYPAADLVRRSNFARRVARFIAMKRYLFVLRDEFSFTGWLSVEIGEPICGAIGLNILRRRYG